MTPFEAIAGIANACQLTPTLITGGQPSAEQLAAFKAAGGAVVLDARDPMEPRPFDEPGRIKALGLEYVNVPVVSGQVDDRVMERILAAVRAHKDRPMLFHCGSGNRVGGALLAYFILDLKMEEEAAIEQAMRVGLRSPEMMQWGLEYAAAHGG
ncbi:MAG TPA: sulfur transferase domain-containing protein [Gemmatimonadales bacterium]|nr:sulfur transferase domain-containing protein [Gemmatimonadales bacterium]